MLPRLVIITDQRAPLRHGRSMLGTLARAFDDVVVDASVVVVVRDRALSAAAMAERCVSVRHVVARAGARVFVHGHPSLVGPCHLDGAHLPSTMDPRTARLVMPRGTMLGISAHPHDDVGDDDRCAIDDVCAIGDVDYATWSPIFQPTSKADTRPPLGLRALAGHRTPVVALGGIDADNAADAVAAGAVGVAVLGTIMGTAQPEQALRALCAALSIPCHRRSRRPRPSTTEPVVHP